MGRHRKPTSSSISVAKIAVTGAVIGGGAVGMAAQAQAASDSEWDTVARCESSGNWAINTGNGFQGGLQFSPSTWLGYGGGQFASAANYATREQQIAIAEKVLAGQGKGAWPVCGRGLSGPTPRNVVTSKPAAPATPATPATTDSDTTSATPLDAALPQDAPAPQDLPADTPVPTELPAPQDAVAPQPEIISIGEETGPAPDDQIISVDAVTPGPEQPAADAVVIDAGFTAPAPMAPADPAVPPVAPTTVAPAPPAAPAAPADPNAPTAVASDQVGVPHLPSPGNPPPGTTDDPLAQTESPNVSYLKDLWHALQNQEINRSDLLLALAQRSFTTPVPTDAGPAAPGPVEAAAPAPLPPAPAPAPETP